MSSAARYFDNAATTPLDPHVLEAMMPFLTREFGNASSIHSFGLRAAAAVEHATEQLASLLGVAPEQLIFTSGATESNNWIARSAKSLAIGPFEHDAMLQPALALGQEVLENEGLEILEPLKPVGLISIMSVNNEIGTRWDVRNFAASAKELHSDITQSVGKIPLALEEVDFASLSAHKFYGPKGVGALYARDHAPEFDLILGGEQQQGERGGTLNVAGIVGMGAAAAIAADRMEEDYEKVVGLRSVLLDGVARTSDVQINGGDQTSPYILSLSFLGIEGETMVIELDRAGFAVSAGAACFSGSQEPSHVLTRLGMDPEWLRGTIRISFGRGNSIETTEKLAKEIERIAEKLRTM